MFNRTTALIAMVGLIILTMVGVNIYMRGEGGLVYILFPGAMALFSVYAYFNKR